MQFVSPSGQEAVVLIFRAESAQNTKQLQLRGLKPDLLYVITFANGSRPDLKMTGHDLLSRRNCCLPGAAPDVRGAFIEDELIHPTQHLGQIPEASRLESSYARHL